MLPLSICVISRLLVAVRLGFFASTVTEKLWRSNRCSTQSLAATEGLRHGMKERMSGLLRKDACTTHPQSVECVDKSQYKTRDRLAFVTRRGLGAIVQPKALVRIELSGKDSSLRAPCGLSTNIVLITHSGFSTVSIKPLCHRSIQFSVPLSRGGIPAWRCASPWFFGLVSHERHGRSYLCD